MDVAAGLGPGGVLYIGLWEESSPVLDGDCGE